jgi:hypothetical protein
VSSLVIAPLPPEYLRPSEFDTEPSEPMLWDLLHIIRVSLAPGGGMDFTYWLPWKYGGDSFQSAGACIRGGGGSQTVTLLTGLTEPVTGTGGRGGVPASV